MDNSNSVMARQVALAACDFERRRTGNSPKSVTVVLGEHTVVITCTVPCRRPRELWRKSPQVPLKCRSFTANCSTTPPIRCGRRSDEVTGADVREAAVEVEPTTGSVVKAFASGTVVEVFLLADSVTAGTWSGSGRDGQIRGMEV